MSCAQDFEPNISAKKGRLIHRFLWHVFDVKFLSHFLTKEARQFLFDCDALLDGVSTETPGFQHGCCGI